MFVYYTCICLFSIPFSEAILEVARAGSSDLGRFNGQLRPWLLSRVRCFEASLDLAAENQDFSTDKLRRVLAERERFVYTVEADLHRKQLAREKLDLEAELRRQAASGAEEADALLRRLAEAELEHTREAARLEGEARARAEDQRREAAGLEGLLREARTAGAELREQLSLERQAAEDGRARAERERMGREELRHLLRGAQADLERERAARSAAQAAAEEELAMLARGLELERARAEE